MLSKKSGHNSFSKHLIELQSGSPGLKRQIDALEQGDIMLLESIRSRKVICRKLCLTVTQKRGARRS